MGLSVQLTKYLSLYLLREREIMSNLQCLLSDTPTRRTCCPAHPAYENNISRGSIWRLQGVLVHFALYLRHTNLVSPFSKAAHMLIMEGICKVIKYVQYRIKKKVNKNTDVAFALLKLEEPTLSLQETLLSLIECQRTDSPW